MSSVFLVTATVRKHQCDRKSTIVELCLDTTYNGWRVHPLVELVELANKHLLWVSIGHGVNPVRVEIFWSPAHGHYIARTTADSTFVNNLDKLPIIRPSGRQFTAGVVNYETCAI